VPRQGFHFVPTRKEKVAIGIGIALMSITNSSLHDTKGLGSNNPGLTLFEAVQQDGTNPIGIEGRHGPDKVPQLVGGWDGL
jgi:hypothetical protein